MFSQEEVGVEGSGVRFMLTATARFSEVGDYVVRLQTVDWDLGNAFGFHCCWTNSYLRVAVYSVGACYRTAGLGDVHEKSCKRILGFPLSLIAFAASAALAPSPTPLFAQAGPPSRRVAR